MDIMKQMHNAQTFPIFVPYLNGKILHSGFKFNILNFTREFLIKQIRNCLFNYLKPFLVKNIVIFINKYPYVYYYLKGLYILTINIYHRFNCIVIKLEKKFPLLFSIIYIFYVEYINIIRGKLTLYHLKLFIVLGLFINDSNYFLWVLLMLLSKYMRDSIVVFTKKYNIKDIKLLNTSMSMIIIGFFNAIYLVSLYSCLTIICDTLILPLFKKV